MRVPQKSYEKLAPFLGRKVLHIHTPKCAGSSTWTAFPSRRWKRSKTVRHPKLRGHLTYIEYRDRLAEIGESIKDYLSFSLVRNPWAWRVSWFTYIQKENPRRSGHAIEHELFKKMSFQNYLEWLYDPDAAYTKPKNEGRNIIRQELPDWFTDEKNEIACDAVLTAENIAEDMLKFSSKHALLTKRIFMHKNRSNTEDYRQFYKSADIEFVATKNAKLLSKFPYDFDNSTEVKAVI